MISEEIKDNKKFMNTLLGSDRFDTFLVNEAVIVTYSTFTIDGHIKKEFYSDDEYDALNINNKRYCSYGTIRQVCYNLIKGHKAPLKIKFIFAMNNEVISSLISKSGINLSPNDINDLFLNIKYENGTITYVTGTSLKIFTMDKSLEKAFDKYISELVNSL